MLKFIRSSQIFVLGLVAASGVAIAPAVVAAEPKQIQDYGEANCAVIREALERADCYHIQALSLQDQGNFQGAISLYTMALQANPTDVDSYYNRGVAYYDAGNPNAAIADYTQAIALNPQDEDAFYNRGLARYDLGDIDGAIADFNATLRINPNAEDAQGWLEYIELYHF